MAGLGLRVRTWFRSRRALVLVTAVLVGVVAGLAMGLVAGTRRTASAPDRYTSWSGGDPGLIIQQQTGDPLTDAVAAMPGVRSADGYTFVTAFLRGPDGSLVFRPNPFAGTDRFSGSRLVEGRNTSAHAPDEFTVSPTMAAILRRRFGSHVGDRFPVSSYSRDQIESNRAFGTGDKPEVPTFTARWVGVIDDPANFEDDSPAIYYSPGFIAAHPDVGVVQSLIEAHLAPGTDPRSILRAVRQMPDGRGAYTISSRIVSDESRRVVRFQATALWIVTGIILLGAVIVVMLLLGRVVRRPTSEARALAALGLRSRDLAVERVCEALACAAVALAVALVVVFAVSDRFPLGALHVFEPHPGRSVDWTVFGLGAVALLVVATGAALLAAPRERVDGTAVARRRPLLSARGGVPFVLGAHFARGRPDGDAAFARVPARRGRRHGRARRRSRRGAQRRRHGAHLDPLGRELRRPARQPVRGDEHRHRRAGGGDTRGVAVDGGAHRRTRDRRLADAHPRDRARQGRAPAGGTGGSVTSSRCRGRAGRRGRQPLGRRRRRHRDARGRDRRHPQARVVGIVVTPDSAGGGAAVPFALYRDLNPSATRNVLFADYRAGTEASVLRQLRADNFSPPDALPAPSSVAALRRCFPHPSSSRWC